MTYVPEPNGTKAELRKSKRQVCTIIDLNKILPLDVAAPNHIYTNITLH